jgi:hypothetical protein
LGVYWRYRKQKAKDDTAASISEGGRFALLQLIVFCENLAQEICEGAGTFGKRSIWGRLNLESVGLSRFMVCRQGAAHPAPRYPAKVQTFFDDVFQVLDFLIQARCHLF